MVKPHSNFESVATNNACSVLKNSKLSYSCNPALHPFVNQEKVSAFAVGKSEGDSVENTRKLLFEKIERDFVQSLFQGNNFNSFTMNSGIEFYNKYFYASYNPYYLLTDFLISNPVSPKISLSLIKRNSLKLGKGQDIAPFLNLEDSISFHIGGNITYYQEEYTSITFSLIELAVYDMETLINLQKNKGILFDFGTYLEVKDWPFVPQIAFQVHNINSKDKVDNNRIESVNDVELKFIKEMYYSLGGGYNYEFEFGSFYAGMNMPISEAGEVDAESISFAGKYGLNFFSFYTSMSRYFQTIGTTFNTSNTNVGLVYGFEKEIRNFNSDREKTVYLQLEINLQ